MDTYSVMTVCGLKVPNYVIGTLNRDQMQRQIEHHIKPINMAVNFVEFNAQKATICMNLTMVDQCYTTYADSVT